MSMSAIGPVLKYPGAKWRMADWIVENMPKHKTYLEPFFGSGAVLFNKTPSPIETVNDLDENLTLPMDESRGVPNCSMLDKVESRKVKP